MAVDERRVRQVAEDVSRYLATRPDASDTVDGIARWWLARQRLDDAEELVLAALELLVERGVVEKVVVGEGVTLFRRSPAEERA